MKNSLLLILVFPLISLSQQTNSGCSHLKELTFYAYPRNSIDQYKIVRTGNKQIEYNLKTADSTEYKVKWEKDCQYSLTYISSSEKKSPAQEDMLKKYKLAYEILSVSADYYVYNIYLDKVINSKTENWQMSTDTVWLQPNTAPANRILFEPLKEKTAHLKRHFNDTSSYAIIYLYRPNKVWGMLASYYVYMGQDFIFPAMNKTKAAYKIYKEGPVKIHAKMSKVEAAVPLDIKFGRKYYIECLLDNSPPKTTAVIRSKEEVKGQIDFESL